MALSEIIGLIGVALMLLAYAGVISGRLGKESRVMHGLNLSGSLMVVYSLMYHWNLPTFVVEVAWSSVAAWGLLRSLRRVRT